MTTKFEIFGKSIKDPEKHKNGDFYDYAILDNKLVILALADGVGSKNCDWLASQTACKLFIQFCKEQLGENYTPDDIRKICNQVDFEIAHHTEENCKGMLTVFSVIVWSPKNDSFHFINIGDTRIYKCSNGDLWQISEDQTKDVIMRDKSGKLLTSNGSTIIKTGVTNALGTGNATIKVEINTLSFGEALILASDGFYNCLPTFKSDMVRLIQTSVISREADKIFRLFIDYQIDDASILVLRRNDINPETQSKYKNIDDFENIIESTPKHLLPFLLIDDLRFNIENKNKEICLRIFDVMINNSILPSASQLDELLAFCKISNFIDGQIYSKIMTLIRNSKR